MAKTTDRQIVNGQEYLLMDSEGRANFSDLVNILNNYYVRGGANDHIITDTSAYNSLADIPPNGIYLVGQYSEDIFPDFPSSIHQGLLITLNRTLYQDATVQIFAEKDGDIYIRNKFGDAESAFASWKQINQVWTNAVQNIPTVTSSSQYASLADLPTNSITFVGIYGEGDTMPDLPDGQKAGIVITFSRTERDFFLQFFVTTQGKILTRTKVGSTAGFTAWRQINHIAPVFGNGRTFTSSEQYASLAELPVNELFLVGFFGEDTLPDFPSEVRSGLCISLNYSETNDARAQFFMDSRGGLWYRMRFGASASFTAWYCLNRSESPEFKDVLYYSFNIVGIIGDSLASGAEQNPYDNNTWYFPDEGRWGYVMSQASGKTYKYFTRGGVSTRTWFTEQDCYELAVLPENYCQCYIIGLGENDSYNLGADYLGTPADIDYSDPDNNADTYYGNYAKIVQKMKEQVPNAKFFLITNPHNQTSLRKQYNEAVRYIANHFDHCFVVDLAALYETEFNTGYINSCRRGGHYCSEAYHYIGEIIAKEINEIMYNNPNEFYGAQFIPTNAN